MRLLIIIVIILQGTSLDAEELKVHPQLSLERTVIKTEEADEVVDTFRVEVDTGLLYRGMKVVAYPVVERNLQEGEDDLRFRKAYIAYQPIEGIYVSVGRQPILWGVGRGRNPTNFIRELALLERQQRPYLLEEGVDSALLTVSYKDIALENVVSFSKFLRAADAYSVRCKALLNNWDTSLSFYTRLKGEDPKVGITTEGDIRGLFNLYSEVAFDTGPKDCQYLIGLSRLLSVSLRSNLDIEYLKGANEEIVFLQLSLFPMEELSGLFIASYDITKRWTYLLPRLNLYLGRYIEMTFVPTFYLKHDSPFEYTIIGGVSLGW